MLSFGIGKDRFVLNKQAPNQELWLSSPLRGPLRYDFCFQAASWLNTRDRHDLLPGLAGDIVQLSDEQVCFATVQEALRAGALDVGFHR